MEVYVLAFIFHAMKRSLKAVPRKCFLFLARPLSPLTYAQSFFAPGDDPGVIRIKSALGEGRP